MSTSEKQEPDADPEFERRDRVLMQNSFLIFATCFTALTLWLTRINSADSFLEGTIKLIPPFSVAIVIQAVVLHATLLRAIWTGRFPDGSFQKSFLEFQASIMSGNWYFFHGGWRYVAGFFVGSLWAFGAYHSLWWALRCAYEAGKRTRADSAVEEGLASIAEAAVDKSHPSTANSAANDSHDSTTKSTADNSHAPSRLITTMMLAFSSIGFLDLALALYSETIDSALTFFGPCFLTALIAAALMLHGALSLPRKLHGSNGRYLVFAYRQVGLIVLPWTCLALGFAMWYYKGRPLYPGVYGAVYWASAVFVGVAEVLEQSLLSS